MVTKVVRKNPREHTLQTGEITDTGYWGISALVFYTSLVSSSLCVQSISMSRHHISQNSVFLAVTGFVIC